MAQYVASGLEHFELKFIYRDVDDLIGQIRVFQHGVITAFRSNNLFNTGTSTDNTLEGG
jgi:hypothetical protein